MQKNARYLTQVCRPYIKHWTLNITFTTAKTTPRWGR